VCVHVFGCVFMCIYLCDRERDLSTPSLHNGQAPALGAEEVRGKMTDENLELEER